MSARASSQAVTADGTAFVPFGCTVEPAERGPLPGEPGLLVGGQRRHRVGEHRVVPVLHAGRAGVVRLPGELEPVAPVRPDPAGQPHGHLAVHQVPALLDVQLDEAADARPAGRASPRSTSAIASSSDTPSRSVSDRASRPRRGPGGQPRPEAGQPEPRPLLLDEHPDPDRDRRRHAAVAEHVDGGQRGHHAERSVVRTAVVDRVQVRPGEHRAPAVEPIARPVEPVGPTTPPGSRRRPARRRGTAPRTARGTRRRPPARRRRTASGGSRR